MIEVPQSFRAMPRWWSDDVGRAWLDRLPSLVTQMCERWDLAIDGPVLHGSNALVVLVRQGSQLAALRLTPPGDDLAAETAALIHWNGHGVVRLLDVDLGARASLLERLDHTRSLGSEPILEAVATLGALTRVLAIPAPKGIKSTRDMAAEAADSFGRQWHHLDQPTPRRLLEMAVAEASALAEIEAGSFSVNGDFTLGRHSQEAATRGQSSTPFCCRGTRSTTSVERSGPDSTSSQMTAMPIKAFGSSLITRPSQPNAPGPGSSCVPCPTCCGGCRTD